MSDSDKDALLVLSIICLFYSLLVGGGGIYAYKFKQSKASLAIGGSSGICLLVTTLVTFVLQKRVEAWGALAIITVALLIVATVRWRLYPGEDGEKKFMPMGLLSITSGIVLLLELIALIIIEA